MQIRWTAVQTEEMYYLIYLCSGIGVFTSLVQHSTNWLLYAATMPVFRLESQDLWERLCARLEGRTPPPPRTRSTIRYTTHRIGLRRLSLVTASQPSIESHLGNDNYSAIMPSSNPMSSPPTNKTIKIPEDQNCHTQIELSNSRFNALEMIILSRKVLVK